MKIRNLDYDLKILINKAWDIRRKNFPSEIEFDIPTKTQPISLTGLNCSLNCAHCGGHYLKGMTSIDEFKNTLRSNIYTSYLISGGCNELGAIDFENNLNFIKDLKLNSKKINMYVGLLPEKNIKEISNIADCVSFDFLTDTETIHEVYGLDKNGADYIETYKNLRKHVRVFPHICIGLKGGEIKGEYKALDVLKKIGADGLVFIVFIPTPNTRYANRKPPELEEILRLLARARIDFPNTPIHLGCMRPKGKLRAEIDHYAIQCGINKLATPTSYGIRMAKELSLSVIEGKECCVL